MSEKEKNDTRKITEEVIKFAEALRDDTEGKKWIERYPGCKDIALKAAAFQTVGRLMGHMFKPLDFNKKFKIVIEHDPDDEAENVYFKYYSE